MVNEPAAVRGVAAAFLTLSSLAVFLRCYVRLRIVRAFGWDDLIMIVAMVCLAIAMKTAMRLNYTTALLCYVLRLHDGGRSLRHRETSLGNHPKAADYCNGGTSPNPNHHPNHICLHNLF